MRSGISQCIDLNREQTCHLQLDEIVDDWFFDQKGVLVECIQPPSSLSCASRESEHAPSESADGTRRGLAET